MTVYDQKTATGTPNGALSLTNGSTSFGYAKGDFVLVNAYTTGGTYTTTGTVAQAPNTVYGEIVGKAESFEGAQTSSGSTLASTLSTARPMTMLLSSI